MKIRIVSFATLFLLILVVAGCATEPKAYEGLASAKELKANKEGPAEYLYKAPNVDFKKYTKFIIPPVAIYTGADAQFGDATDEQKQEMADYIRSQFTEVLDQGGYKVVNQTGPGVAELKLTFAGLELTKPALSTISHLAPAGIAMNLGKGATKNQGSFMGSVTYAGEIYDSQSNKLIAAFVTKQHASALDYTAITSKLESAKAGVTKGAEDFKNAIDRIQKGMQ